MSSTYNGKCKNQVKVSTTGRMPHTSKKRVKNKIKDTEICTMKFNPSGLLIACTSWFLLEGDITLRIILGCFAIISSLSFKEE